MILVTLCLYGLVAVLGILSLYTWISLKYPTTISIICLLSRGSFKKKFRCEFVRFLHGYFEYYREEILCIKPFRVNLLALSNPDLVEAIINNNSYINKAKEYKALEAYLGAGLITSNGDKWKSRRRLLTPAFHFKILDDFMPVFQQHSMVMCNILDKHVDEPFVDIVTFAASCTLDVICTSAMGVNMNIQLGECQDYVDANNNLGEIAIYRGVRPWLYYDFVFNLTTSGRLFKKSLKVIREFSKKVIKEKRQEYLMEKCNAKNGVSQNGYSQNGVSQNGYSQNGISQNGYSQNGVSKNGVSKNGVSKNDVSQNGVSQNGVLQNGILQNGISLNGVSQNNVSKNGVFENGASNVRKKKQRAFLELLLDIQQENPSFTEEDIQEEVDTFIVAGHDTTAMGIAWAVYLVGLDDRVQAEIQRELYEIYGDDLEQPVTREDCARMKYLGYVIKETLRLYPPGIVFGRHIDEEMTLCAKNGKETVIPSNTTAVFFLYATHRNPDHFPDPEKFIPERFLPENCNGRHPYAYIPFSAGSRNCIGQRFALLEEKVVLSNLFRRFHVKSLDQRDKLDVYMSPLCRNDGPLRMKLTRRNRNEL